jgi:anti-sigma B factor antagonist
VELTERRAGKAVVVAPVGRIDMATAEQLKGRLIPLVSDAAHKGEVIVLDFAGVDYISSAGLLAAKEAKTSGSKLAVAALQPLVNEIFEISRFNKVLACHTGVDEAIAALSTG